MVMGLFDEGNEKVDTISRYKQDNNNRGKMNNKKEKQRIAKHIHGIVGGTPQFTQYSDKKNESFVSIMSIKDIPWEDVVFYSTVGLSDYSIGLKVNELSLRTEFIILTYDRQEWAAEILSTCAFNIINSHYGCKPGTIFYDVISLYEKNSKLKHIMFVPPFVWEESYQGLTLADKVVEWLLAVPISEKEAQYAEKYGSDVLEELFEREQIDYCDLYRKSVL